MKTVRKERIRIPENSSTDSHPAVHNMNILVALDGNYVGPLCVLLKSLMISNPNGIFDLYVAHSSLKKEHFDRIDKAVDKKRVTVHPVEIDPALLNDAPVMDRISKETYYRLLLMDYLPKEVDRILYIDPDTIIINDIRSFYNIDFKGKTLAACGHTKSWCEFLNRVRFHSPKDVRYFNAGVIMFNVDKLRKTVTSDDIFRYMKKHRRWLFLADQDVLNGMFNTETVFADECIYNLDEKTVKFNKDRVKDLDWVRKNTVIVHFNGKFKPWKPGYQGILLPLYYEYRDMPWKND